VSVCPCLSAASQRQRGALAQWYGTPLTSKYAARRNNRVAVVADNIGDGVGWVGTVYPAKSWGLRGRAHEYLPPSKEFMFWFGLFVCLSVRPADN